MTREEAINLVKQVLPCLNIDEKIREGFETLIPELKESEDERIRKGLIAMLSQDKDLHHKEIAYLEKQKINAEKEYIFRPLAGSDIVSAALQAIRKANEGDRLVLAFNGAYIPVRKGCNANKIVEIYEAFIERQKEQMPMGSEEKFESIDNAFRRGRETGFREGVESVKQPVEWSEDDSIKIGTLSGIIFDYAFYKDALDENNDLTGEYAELDNWLGYLPERFNLPPKQEWGEEDETRFTNILIMLKEYAIHHYTKDDVNKSVDWLENRFKSLRPSKDCSSCAQHLEGYISGRGDAENKLLEQFGAVVTPEDELHIKPRWKPSEEQMEALNAVLEHEAERVGSSKELEKANALYEQLQRL